MKKTEQEERLRETYIQEQELPEKLRAQFHIVSCLSWREEQSVYLLEDREGTRSIIKRAEGKRKEALKREAQFLERLHFSFLPAFLSWNEEDDTGWLQRAYIPGDTLWELVERGEVFDAARAGELLCRLCEIAGQLHRSDPPIIHRDFKPQNIVLTPEGNLFLIDLGTVRAYREGAPYDTEFMGTRKTAAPEQYGYRQTDCRTDIYALGVIYLYLLTGSMELQNEKVLSGVPKECRDIIERCTRMDPKERYGSAEQLQRAVRETTASGGRAKRAGKTSAFRRLLLAAAALAVVLLAAGICGKLYFERLPYQFCEELVGQAVRRQLGKAQGETVTRAELAGLKSLRICGDRILAEGEQHWQYDAIHRIGGEEVYGSGTIADLSDFHYMKNLQTLILDRQEITDITPLEGLPLVSVSLCDNPIWDISALAKRKTLEELYIEETQVTDLAEMENMTALRILRLSNEQPADLTPVAELPLEELCLIMITEDSAGILQKLPLKKLQLHSWSKALEEKIGELTELTKLTIYGYQNETLAPLLALTGLEELNLYGGRLESVEEIENFPELYFLGINNTAVADIAPLTGLDGLTQLGLDNTEITDFSVLNELKELQWVQCDETQRPQIERIADSLWFTLETVPKIEDGQ